MRHQPPDAAPSCVICCRQDRLAAQHASVLTQPRQCTDNMRTTGGPTQRSVNDDERQHAAPNAAPTACMRTASHACMHACSGACVLPILEPSRPREHASCPRRACTRPPHACHLQRMPPANPKPSDNTAPRTGACSRARARVCSRSGCRARAHTAHGTRQQQQRLLLSARPPAASAPRLAAWAAAGRAPARPAGASRKQRDTQHQTAGHGC